MSYPRKIHALIVEDELGARESYKEIFRDLSEELDLAPPTFAISYRDALEKLYSPSIFHIVILDLGLPMEPLQPAVDNMEPGLNLIERAAARDDYPIPVLLVVSGLLGRARLNELKEKLDKSFWYGQLVNKGVEEYAAIQVAIEKVRQYCDIGLHIRDSKDRLFPTLSPREEDLLRRCILKHPPCIGVDLEWWGADHSYFHGGTPQQVGWTKVLMGYFLLDEGKGISLPTFFKLEPSANALVVHRDAAIMQHKLSHVKVCCTFTAGTRSLIATQKVGETSQRPISLHEFLCRPTEEVEKAIPEIIEAITAQLTALGNSSLDQVPVKRLLWTGHNTSRLLDAWDKYSPSRKLSYTEVLEDPVNLFVELSNSNKTALVSYHACTHGDLNATNIALEEFSDHIRAYIFDASGVKADVNIRDLAMLEVTSLLHQPSGKADSLVRLCEAMYKDFVLVPDDFDLTADSDIERNTRKLIAEIRRHALKLASSSIYALMVFDNALIQLGGLFYGSSCNKITNSADAALLAALTAKWTRYVAPDLF